MPAIPLPAPRRDRAARKRLPSGLRPRERLARDRPSPYAGLLETPRPPGDRPSGGTTALPAPRSPQRLYEESLPVIEEIIRLTSRRRRMSPDEAEEFASTVRLRLLEDGCRILRAFRGGSTLKTYLVTVIQRIAVDERIRRTGKWHASARARRLGETAMRLEELMGRRGMAPEEACRQLLAERGVDDPLEELLDVCRRLPVRVRPREVALEEAGPDGLPGGVSPERSAAARLEEIPRAEAAGAAIQAALDGLDSGDRLLLKLRFESGLTVPEVSRILGGPSKRLYKRTEWILQRLRRALRDAGFDLGAGEADLLAPWLEIHFGPQDPGGRSPAGPSHHAESPGPPAGAAEDHVP